MKSILEKMFESPNPYTFIAMPLLVKERFKPFLGEGLNVFQEKRPDLYEKDYFSSFELFEKYPWLMWIERPIRKKPSREMSGIPYLIRRGYEKFLINLCKAKAANSKSVLYIVPEIYEIDKTITLGAISECDHALSKKVPVFVYTASSEKDFSQISSINEIFERRKLKAPAYWLERENSLRLDRKFIQ